MKPPKNSQYLLFGGTFVLANKLQFVGDRFVKGLSTKRWFLLRNLLEMPQDPPPTISLIAQAMDSTRQNITKMLEVMEREGYVTIETNPLDHRSRTVTITTSGRNHTMQMAQNAQDYLKRLFEGISTEESDLAGQVLIKMVDNLQKMQEEL